MNWEHIFSFFNKNSQYLLNIIGLCFDLLGVVLLVYCVLDSPNGLKADRTKPLPQQLTAWAKKHANTPRVKRWAVSLIIVGFLMQILGNIIAIEF